MLISVVSIQHTTAAYNLCFKWLKMAAEEKGGKGSTRSLAQATAFFGIPCASPSAAAPPPECVAEGPVLSIEQETLLLHHFSNLALAVPPWEFSAEAQLREVPRPHPPFLLSDEALRLTLPRPHINPYFRSRSTSPAPPGTSLEEFCSLEPVPITREERISGVLPERFEIGTPVSKEQAPASTDSSETEISERSDQVCYSFNKGFGPCKDADFSSEKDSVDECEGATRRCHRCLYCDGPHPALACEVEGAKEAYEAQRKEAKRQKREDKMSWGGGGWGKKDDWKNKKDWTASIIALTGSARLSAIWRRCARGSTA